MHESVDVVLRYGISDPLRPGDMDVFEIEVPKNIQSARSSNTTMTAYSVLGRVVAANEVVDNVGVPHALLD